MTHLRKIVYVSAAARKPSPGKLEHLLQRARERNAAANVTGVLLYCDGNFMQYIEGPRVELQAIYDIILADPMHSSVIELVNAPIVQREFADWSMAFNTISTPEFIRLSEASWIEEEQPASLSSGRELLREFWKNARR